MDTVWDLDEASVRRSWTSLNRDAPKPRAYTTYMTILGRLHGKGLLDRRREGKTDVYRAVHSRDRVRRPARAGRGGRARRHVRRRRARPLRPPGRRPRPRAPRGARAPRPWPLTRTRRTRDPGARTASSSRSAGPASPPACSCSRPASARSTSSPPTPTALDVAASPSPTRRSTPPPPCSWRSRCSARSSCSSRSAPRSDRSVPTAGSSGPSRSPARCPAIRRSS